MAIVNTFSKCLESPYLFHDPEAPRRVAGLLRFAGERLEAASHRQANPRGDAADIALFSYESMFACIRALVYAKGYREAGLSCLLIACKELYVTPGDLELAHLVNFERAQGLRLPPAEALSVASELARRTLELLGSGRS